MLNDFDISFIITKTDYISVKINNPDRTLLYASPEQLGIPDSNIGYASDVFSAALISYKILNGAHPAEYDPDKFESLSVEAIERHMKKVFNQMAKGNLSWTPPRFGSNNLKGVILKAMDINKNKRDTAKEVLDALNKEINKAPEIKPEADPVTTPKIKTEPVNTEEKTTLVPKPKEKTKFALIFIVILSIVLIVSICGVIICYLFSNFISSGNNSGVTPTPNTVAVTTDAPDNYCLRYRSSGR